MYRILSKIHTISNNFYEMYTVLNDENERIEYGVDSLEEAKVKAKELLCKEGYCDLKIINDTIYHIDVLEGAEEKPVEETYTVNIIVDKEYSGQCTITPNKIENIKKGASINTGVQFNEIIPSFHLIIDGQDFSSGIPEWIEFKPMDAQSGILYFNGITNNHEVIIAVDKKEGEGK